jgi:hypothetical protein
LAFAADWVPFCKKKENEWAFWPLPFCGADLGKKANRFGHFLPKNECIENLKRVEREGGMAQKPTHQNAPLPLGHGEKLGKIP